MKKKLALIMATLLLGTTIVTGCSSQDLYLKDPGILETSSNEQVQCSSQLQEQETMYGYTGVLKKYFPEYEKGYAIKQGIEDLPIVEQVFYDDPDNKYPQDYIYKEDDKMSFIMQGKTDLLGSAFISADLNSNDEFLTSCIVMGFSEEENPPELDFMTRKEASDDILSIIKNLGVDTDFIFKVYTGFEGAEYNTIENEYKDGINIEHLIPQTVKEDFYYIEGVNCIDNIPFSMSRVENSSGTIDFKAVYTKNGLVCFDIRDLNCSSNVEKCELTVSKETALELSGANLLKKQGRKLISINLVLYAIYEEPDVKKRDYIGKRTFSTGWEVISESIDTRLGEMRETTVIDAITGKCYKAEYSQGDTIDYPYNIYELAKD